MKLDDLDQILLSEKRIEPSSSFSESVMERIEVETSHPSRIQLSRMLLILAALLLAILTVAVFPSDKVLESTNYISNSIVNWLIYPSCPALCAALLPLGISFLGTILLVWFSLRLAGAK
jgi:hypothetical protein